MVLFPPTFFLLFISQTSYRTYIIISSYELARTLMGTLFLVIIIIILIHFFAHECTEVVATSLTPQVTNFPGIRSFIIGFSFTVWSKKSAKIVATETSKRMLTKFVSIGSYSPEVRTFGTLITSTKVFSLIIGKTLCQNDPLPRYLRLCT